MRRTNRDTAKKLVADIIDEMSSPSRHRFVEGDSEEKIQFIYLILGESVALGKKHLIWAEVTLKRTSTQIKLFHYKDYPEDDFLIFLKEEFGEYKDSRNITVEIVATNDQPNLDHTGVSRAEIIF